VADATFARSSRPRRHRGAVRANPAIFDAAQDEDVHSFVERELVARIGDAGKRLHTGRSRNEQVSVDFRLVSSAPDSGHSARGRDAREALAHQAPRQASRRCRRTRTCAARSPCWWRTRGCRTAAAFARDVDRFEAHVPRRT
jgi:argininosuccinate lyase